jgi:hypothetical protein
MASANPPSIAYLTVVEDERTGWTGGLLHLSPSGRPIEFQCTLPVRTTRTHEILFGATLRDHLIGDVIGPLLVRKARTPIKLLCCDQPEALHMQQSFDFPVALVQEAAEAEEGPISDDTWIGSAVTMLGKAHLRVAIEQLDAAQSVCQQMTDLPDALEPLERIREAIKEAHSQIARASLRVDSSLSEAA